MILDLIKLLKPGEIIEIRDNAHEIEVILWDTNDRVIKSGQLFNIQELEKIKRNKNDFSKQLIKQLRHNIKIHKAKN